MLRLRVRLSFRRSDVPNEDTLASAGLEASTLNASSLLPFLACCNRGPVNLGCLFPDAPCRSPVAPLLCLKYPKSPLVLGRDDETNGEMDFLSFRSVAIGICELVLLGALYAAESGLTV